MKLKTLPHRLIAFLIAATATITMHSAYADEVALIDTMKGLQYFTHKTSLAVDAKNAPLAEFYTHELEELLEELTTVPSYHGQPIAKLSDALLKQSFERLETAIKKQQWPQSSQALDLMIDSCNQCHKATQHGFIEIQRQSHNPYFQKF
ncbi:MAG: hypothetical protein ACRBBW_14635 [Cellvibrionaceae bacterium]